MPMQLANLGMPSKSRASTRSTRRMVTRSMSAATRSRRAAALVKARAARGKSKLPTIKENNVVSSKKGGFWY